MKKIALILVMSLGFLSPIYSQYLTPNVDLVADIISQKQEELKQRVLKNIVVKNIKTTNYTTYNTIYRLVEILTTEKNKTVMTQNLIGEIADYSVIYALSDYFVKNQLTLGMLVNKSVGDDQGVYELLSLNISKTDKNRFTKQTTKFQEGLIPEGLLTNYIIDELYKLLSNESSYLVSKGFFKNNSLNRRFEYGLDIDYSTIEESQQKALIDQQLSSFVSQINTSLSSANEVFDFINESGKNLDDLKTLNNKDIGFIFKIFSISLDKFRYQIGQNSFIAKVGDIITKYVIYDTFDGDPDKVYSFKLDVEAIILGFEDSFYNSKITTLKNNSIGIEPFFGIGINYGLLTNSNNDILDETNNESIYQVAFVSEKIGLKFLFADYEYTRSHKPLEWYRYKGEYRSWKGPVKEPIINNVYGFVFVSGILYNVVDLKSEDNFNFAIVGAGFGLTFFNDLELNLSYTLPFVEGENSFDNSMINVGFDIPIFEYLRASRK